MIYLSLPALIAIAIPLWVLARLWRYYTRRSFSLHREIAYAAPFLYGLTVVYFAFFHVRIPLGDHSMPIYRSLNLKPVVETIRLLNDDPQSGVHNIIGNILLFLPFGILAPWLRRSLRNPGRVAEAAFRLSVGIEVLQYLIGNRASDVDDVLLNTLGAALGYGLYWAVSRFFDRSHQKQSTAG
ncbi:MAG: VanZ family protein [Symbiobacteriia bacterium]